MHDKEKINLEYIKSTSIQDFGGSYTSNFGQNIVFKVASKNKYFKIIPILFCVFLVLGLGLSNDNQLHNIGNIFIGISFVVLIMYFVFAQIIYRKASTEEVTSEIQKMNRNLSKAGVREDRKIPNKIFKYVTYILITISLIGFLIAIFGPMILGNNF